MQGRQSFIKKKKYQAIQFQLAENVQGNDIASLIGQCGLIIYMDYNFSCQ